MMISVVLKVTNYVSVTVKGLAVNAIRQNDVPAVPRLFLNSCCIVYKQWEETLSALITCTCDVLCVENLELLPM